MKIKIKFILIILFFLTSCDSDRKSKYQIGDCITPTTELYSWFGVYARVEAFSKIDGLPDKYYILLFRNYNNNSVIFEKNIETDTKIVEKNKCN